MDEHFDIIGPMRDCPEDRRSSVHTSHSLIQMIRQRIYQIAAGYEDCNDADHLRIDPALRLVIGSGHKIGVSQSMLSLPENEVLGNGSGLEALVAALLRSVDALLRKKDRLRLIIDVDSTEDSAHGSQENSAYDGHFGVSCFHPLFASTSGGTYIRQKPRLATFTRRMGLSFSSIPSWRRTVPISGFPGFGAIPSSPARSSTFTAKSIYSYQLPAKPAKTFKTYPQYL